MASIEASKIGGETRVEESGVVKTAKKKNQGKRTAVLKKKKIENKRNRKKQKEMKKELEEKSRKANYRRNPFFMIAISTSRKRKLTLSILIFVKHC
jgi:hypothetical protein